MTDKTRNAKPKRKKAAGAAVRSGERMEELGMGRLAKFKRPPKPPKKSKKGGGRK